MLIDWGLIGCLCRDGLVTSFVGFSRSIARYLVLPTFAEDVTPGILSCLCSNILRRIIILGL